ncbi:MAG: Ldh family oxidoreductase, partial [Candidatus Eremiobacteraeota bacterium]|nr:Ldh family oxidoreductase [Candidatus Eremiobacteraeota bacterium]
AGAYALQAAEAGMVGIVTTNAPPVMAPWGSLTRMLGNNPIAIAAPRAEGDAFLLDFALSQVAKGWVRLAAAARRPIPAGWAMDAQGQPTTDSAAAMDGLLVPIGMYKGTGLSIAMDILTGFLAGSPPSADLPDQSRHDVPGNVAHFFIALDIARFVPLEEFTSKVAALLARVEGAARALGVDRILLPGKIEADKERVARREGLDIALETWNELKADATRLGVEAPAR